MNGFILGYLAGIATIPLLVIGFFIALRIDDSYAQRKQQQRARALREAERIAEAAWKTQK